MTGAEREPGVAATLMAFFQTGCEELHLALSTDAADPARPPSFTAINGGRSVHSADGGTIRDPALSPRRLDDGAWYLLHTRIPHRAVSYNTATGPRLGFLRSHDLVHWEPVGDGVLDVGMPGLTHCWAPKWFVDDDGTVRVVFSGATAPDHAPTPFSFFELHPLGDDPTGPWSSASALEGEFPADRLDAFIARQADGRYACVYKNRVTHTLELATADALAGPYSFATSWAHWGQQEGAFLVPLADGRWRIFFDWPANEPENYRFADSTGTDLATTTWTGPRGTWGVVGVDTGQLRHGTFARLDAEDAARVRAARY